MICRVASMPFRSGMEMSMITTWGASSWTNLTTSRPLSASPTISMSGSAAQQRAEPVTHYLVVVRQYDLDHVTAPP